MIPIKEFLEEYPLFRKLEESIPGFMEDFPKPSINMLCLKCKIDQTFKYYTDNVCLGTFGGTKSEDRRFSVVYRCQSCEAFDREFHLHISPDLKYIRKLGQYPEWEIKIDKNLAKTLGNKANTFRKGLVCESQGYGIGAFAYYRRITEEIIDELLESIKDLIEPENKDKYLSALEKTKETRVTQEKIELVKDLLPNLLRPDGMNPLGVLHSELSGGIHDETDEICLESASHIRKILTFLINQVIQTKNAKKEFSSSMKSLLEKKSKKTA